jgi:hypothetical protein
MAIIYQQYLDRQFHQFLDILTQRKQQGKKDNKSAYEAIKESGYIISYEDDIFSKEVVS